MRYRHTMLRVSDMDRAIAFYQLAAGFRVKSRNAFDTPPLQITFMQAPGDGDAGPSLELVHDQRLAISPGERPKGHVSYLVSDLHALLERVQRSGGQLLEAPVNTLDGQATLAIFADPDGNEIEIIQALGAAGGAT